MTAWVGLHSDPKISHGKKFLVCGRTSEDTALLILKEIYSPLGIAPIMPGPDGTTPKPVMPPASAPPPPKSVAAYPAPGQASSPPPGSIFPFPPTGQPQGPAFHHPPPTGAPPPHMQGPAARFPSPWGSAGPGSQGSSRGSTPPLGSQGMPQPGNMGPPPMSGFTRSPPAH